MRTACVGLCLAIASTASVVQGQHPATNSSATHVAMEVGRAAPRPANLLLNRPVTVTFKNLSLANAIDSLAGQARVRIYYQLEHLSTAQPVSLRAAEMPLGAALDIVLAGTGLHAVPTTAQAVTVKPVLREERQSGGIITGKIVHARRKQPLAGVTILLDSASQSISTDAQGTFRIPVTSGEHILHIRSLGFVRQARKITVGDEETVTLNVALEPSASVLDQVVVTGTVIATERKAITTPITVITAADIEKRGITRIEQLFRGEVPGVIALDLGTKQYQSELGAMQRSRVYVRGVSTFTGDVANPPPNPLKTYVDGVEILDPAYLGTIDPQSIDRVEIVTGPQAATIYGSGAMGGVMQIFTKKGQGRTSPDIALNFKYGLLQSNLSSGKTPTHAHTATVSGGSGPEFSYSANLSYNYSGQWRPAFFSRSFGGSVGATHTRGPLVASGSFSTTSGRNGTTDQANLSHVFMRESGEWDLGRLPDARMLNRRFGESASQTGSLNLDYQQNKWWQHHFVVGRTNTDFSLVPEAPSFTYSDDSLFRGAHSAGIRTTASYNTTLIPSWVSAMSSTLTLGINKSWGDQSQISGCLVTASSSSYVECSGYGNLSVSRSQNNDSWGGFGQLRLGVFDQLFLTLGLRAEHNASYGEEHKIDWTPTNGLAYTISFGDMTVKLLGSYGRATRPPPEAYKHDQQLTITGWEPTSFISVFGNPLLAPEYSNGPQGGLELYYGNLGSLTLNHYKQTITDLIQYVQVDSLYLTPAGGGTGWYWQQAEWRNLNKIRQLGWEATASLNLWRLTLRGTYSWNDSRVLSSRDASWPVGMSFYGVPSHTGNVTLGYASHGTSITWVTNYVGTSTQRWSDGNLLKYGWSHTRLRMYAPNRRNGGEEWALRGYAKSDLAVTHRLSPSVSATMNIVNVGNSYESDVGFSSPSLGRQTLLGLSLRFPR